MITTFLSNLFHLPFLSSFNKAILLLQLSLHKKSYEVYVSLHEPSLYRQQSSASTFKKFLYEFSFYERMSTFFSPKQLCFLTHINPFTSTDKYSPTALASLLQIVVCSVLSCATDKEGSSKAFCCYYSPNHFLLSIVCGRVLTYPVSDM